VCPTEAERCKLPCRARTVKKLSSASSLNGNRQAALVDGVGDAEGRAEQGGLVGLQGMKASPGRPNISAVLTRVVQEYSGDQEIGVVAAGASRSLSFPAFLFLPPLSRQCIHAIVSLHVCPSTALQVLMTLAV